MTGRPSVGRVWVLVLTSLREFCGSQVGINWVRIPVLTGGGKHRKDKPTLCTRCTEGGFGRGEKREGAQEGDKTAVRWITGQNVHRKRILQKL